MPDSALPERSGLKRFCSASSAHATARTEALKLGLLACLATSNFKRSLGDICRAAPEALFRKCESLQIARSQKGLPWKAFAQPHLPMALLKAQRLELLDCLANSDFQHSLCNPCRMPQAALLRKCERLQIAHRHKGLREASSPSLCASV